MTIINLTALLPYSSHYRIMPSMSTPTQYTRCAVHKCYRYHSHI